MLAVIIPAKFHVINFLFSSNDLFRQGKVQRGFNQTCNLPPVHDAQPFRRENIRWRLLQTGATHIFIKALLRLSIFRTNSTLTEVRHFTPILI